MKSSLKEKIWFVIISLWMIIFGAFSMWAMIFARDTQSEGGAYLFGLLLFITIIGGFVLTVKADDSIKKSKVKELGK